MGNLETQHVRLLELRFSIAATWPFEEYFKKSIPGLSLTGN
jgi:hypothetical protein